MIQVTAQTRVLGKLCRQLGMPPVLFAAPPDRKKTDTEHERRIRAHLGFRTFDDRVRRELAAWLRSRAADGLLGDELVVRAQRHLFSQRVVVFAAQRDLRQRHGCPFGSRACVVRRGAAPRSRQA